MTYSYTQISQYLTCPRRYRYRYLDGWKEKDTRATMLFVALSNKHWGHFFGGKIPERYCLPSGLPVRGKSCAFQTEIPGIACCARESCS
jgi:PD-(D/E)XK nuclease superfamily